MNLTTKSDIVRILAKIIKLSNSNIQYEPKINSFLNILSWELGLEHCLILTIGQDKSQLSIPWQPDYDMPVLSPLPIDDKTIISRSLLSRQTILSNPDEDLVLSEDWANFVEPCKGNFMVTPLTDDKMAYGVLLLLSRNPNLRNSANFVVVEAVANAVSLSIKNFQQAVDNRKRLSVQNVLSDLGRTLSTTIDVGKIMNIVPRIAAGIFLADGCTVNILDETGQKLIMGSHYGIVPPAYNFDRFIGTSSLPESVVSSIKRLNSFSGYLKDDSIPMELSELENSNTIISCPLSFQGHHHGSISLFNKLGGRNPTMPMTPQLFDSDDFELLFSMNNMISGVLENAIIFSEVEGLAQTNEKMVAYLSTLYEISSAMMTTVRYDTLVWIITRALIDRKGLGFDRVLILLLNNDDKRAPFLVSSAAWSYDEETDTDEPDGTLVDLLKNPSQEEANIMLARGREMGLSLPVHAGNSSVLTRVIIEKKPMIGFYSKQGDLEIDSKDFSANTYAAVPLVSKNQDVGVIAVDRSITGQPLTTDNLRDLSMLANQAGLAIENALLYDDLEQANRNLSQVREQLIEAEKVAAQGEMGTHLAHEVRNPLVSIGGFTRRLLKKMAPDDPLRTYANVIWEEVQRVNKVLNNVLDFSRDEIGRVQEFKMEDLLNETLNSMRHELKRQKLTVEVDISPNLAMVSADDRQIMHVILNLMYNASHAMAPKGGVVYARVFETQEAEQHYVACEITDTGPGIPEDVLSGIFKPFFTTRTDGTGLGLSITKKIVERYRGLIEVTNHPPHIPGSGASFTFMFPAVQTGALRL